MVGLSKHQEQGVEWLWEKVQAKKGAILGDEMGTGKTAQVLAVIERVWSEIGQSVLVLAPCTLLENWRREAAKFHCRFPVKILRSPDEDLSLSICRAEGEYVILTNYELFYRNREAFLGLFFDLVVLDEAHRVKNVKTRITRAAKEVDARSKICITGTPIQNSLAELWSIVEIVRPGYFGDFSRFKEEVALPLKRSTLKSASPREKAQGEIVRQRINSLLGETVLRRTKADVGVAVEKEEHVIFCPLTESQQKAYERVLGSDVYSERGAKTLLGRGSPLKAVGRLRSICNHPVYAEKEMTHWRESGKMQAVHRLLFLWRKSGRKIVLFSQYREVLRILERMCRDIGVLERVYRIDGSSPISERERVLKEFGGSSGVEIFLVSSRVGGEGVNLQRADTVIIFDVDWNPYNEEQAKGRVARMGQLEKVEVFRLMCRGTVEESVLDVQGVKKAVAAGVLDRVPVGKLFEKVDLCRLFHYEHDPEDVSDITQYR
ncbi:DNA excision repair protein ERCC-6 [Nematocida major]|uniref:DNA excision repair protein ERCC-6 n=1 Tax=Nematocida major TaxID=1912982 RepID=UPI002007B5B6|nr:DNA excision repair protein ERCC-6 [Nematocida major]KAH9387291.1 DNA excision repair protein ERCC-6 [Nematocida major]